MRMENFAKRFELAFNILFKTKRQHVCIMVCPKCGSSNIEPLEEYDEDSNTNAELKENVEKDSKIDFAYRGVVHCCTCGSVCGSHEYWIYKKEGGVK